MTRRRRELQRLAQRYGFELGQTKRGHFRLRHPNGAIVVASFTSSDGNDLHHVIRAKSTAPPRFTTSMEDCAMTSAGIYDPNDPKWPSREEWAKQHRSLPCEYELRVSERAGTYASQEEIAAALAEAKALWTDMGRQVKAAGPSISDKEWNERYLAASPARQNSGSWDELNSLMDSPERKRIELRHDRSELNRDVIKPLAEGWLPINHHYYPRSADFGLARLPKLKELLARREAAWAAAHEALKAEYAARPVDDAAWEQEQQRRRSVTAFLAG